MKSTLLLVAVASTLLACSKESAPPVKLERPALTQIVGAQAGQSNDYYSGEVRARNETVLGFRIGGKLVERRVDTGDRVKAGQILARLDPADANLQAGSALAQYQLAEAEIKRYRELHSKGFVSQSALDAKEAGFKAASAQAGLTRNQSDYTILRAEHEGVVAMTLAEAGQVVSVGQPVLRVAEDGQREVAIAIPEMQLAGRKIGEAAEVVLLNDGGKTMIGHLRELSAVADPVSRTYFARVSFTVPTEQQGQVALGMTARVRFVNRQQAPSDLLIPVSAIYQQGAKTAVWVVAGDSSVSLRPVEVAAFRDGGAVITAGLKSGERIVSAGAHRLSAGEKIRIIEAGSAQ